MIVFGGIVNGERVNEVRRSTGLITQLHLAEAPSICVSFVPLPLRHRFMIASVFVGVAAILSWSLVDNIGPGDL